MYNHALFLAIKAKRYGNLIGKLWTELYQGSIFAALSSPVNVFPRTAVHVGNRASTTSSRPWLFKTAIKLIAD